MAVTFGLMTRGTYKLQSLQNNHNKVDDGAYLMSESVDFENGLHRN